MFTGLVEETGKIGNVIGKNGILSICVYCENVLSGLKIGESVSVSGICLTVVKIDADSFGLTLLQKQLNVQLQKIGYLVLL